MMATVLVGAPFPTGGGPCSNAGQQIEIWELVATTKEGAIAECQRLGAEYVCPFVPDEQLGRRAG